MEFQCLSKIYLVNMPSISIYMCGTDNVYSMFTNTQVQYTNIDVTSKSHDETTYIRF